MRLNYLFDFYRTLLTPKQQEYMQMYYIEDLSLVEIAKLSQVSRQAVYDNIKRTEVILETYEDKLDLYEKFEQRQKLLRKLEASLERKTNSNTTTTLIQQLKELS